MSEDRYAMTTPATRAMTEDSGVLIQMTRNRAEAEGWEVTGPPTIQVSEALEEFKTWTDPETGEEFPLPEFAIRVDFPARKATDLGPTPVQPDSPNGLDTWDF